MFLGFIELHSKDASSLKKVILERLESDGIPLGDCRSQCYDNASVMAGHISGLQQRICARNPRALFLNCDNHMQFELSWTALCQTGSKCCNLFWNNRKNVYVFLGLNPTVARAEKCASTCSETGM